MPILETPFPKNISQQPGIQRLNNDTAIFKNGVEEKVDVVMLCTGYRYNFPFLHEECKVVITDERVTPLYKHIVHANFPTLAFIGICKTICPFPMFELQVKFVLSLLDGSQKMPSEQEMLSDIEHDFNQRLGDGLPPRYAHTLGPRQWAYNDSLAELGKFDVIPVVVQTLYDEVGRMRVKDLPNYKERQYRLLGDTEFEELLEA